MSETAPVTPSPPTSAAENISETVPAASAVTSATENITDANSNNDAHDESNIVDATATNLTTEAAGSASAPDVALVKNTTADIAPETEATAQKTELTPAAAASSDLDHVAVDMNTQGHVLPAAHSDMDPLRELLQKPPGDVAAWALAQVRDLGEAGTDVETLPIFKLAGALKAAPVEQKQALISSVMQGVGELPVEQRAEALRFMTQLPTDANVAEVAAGIASSAAGDASTASVAAGNASSAEALAPVLSANLARIAKEAAIAEMPPAELEKIGEVVAKEQGQLLTPLLDVVSELSEDERNSMIETLVSKGFVSEANRTILEDTVRPGGHADELSKTLRIMSMAYRKIWWFGAVFVLEILLIFNFISPVSGCDMPLLPWLVGDVVMAICLAGAAFNLRRVLKSTFLEFSENPVKMVTRVQTEMAEGAQLKDVVPGSDPAKYLVVIAVGLVVIGAVWAVYGFVRVFEAMESTCSTMLRWTAVLLCTPIITLRMATLAALVFLSLKAYRKIGDLRGHSSNSGSAPLLSEPAANYGTAQDEVRAEVPV